MPSNLAEVIEDRNEDPKEECDACAARREVTLLYLESLALRPGKPGYAVADRVLLRARRALRAGCTCLRKEPPFDLRAKCRELGCRPRSFGNVN